MASDSSDAEAAKKNRLFAEVDIAKLKVMQSEESRAAKYAMSVGAASIAEAVTYPLDLTKTRLQLQGEIAAGEAGLKYRGMFQTAFGIAKEEVRSRTCIIFGILIDS